MQPVTQYARQAVAASCRASAAAVTVRRFSAAKKSIKVTFVKPDGSKQVVDAPIGDSMLEVAHANSIDIEGACGGETACSTCHIYIDEKFFKKIPELSEQEEDMLDLAAGLKDNSRLGCQVIAAENLDGMTVIMPAEVNNLMK